MLDTTKIADEIRTAIAGTSNIGTYVVYHTKADGTKLEEFAGSMEDAIKNFFTHLDSEGALLKQEFDALEVAAKEDFDKI